MIRNLVIYGVGGAASRFAAIFLVPLYTRALPVEQYGQLELLLALHTLAVLIAGMQSESAVLRDYHSAVRDGTLRQLSWASVAISLSGSVVVGLLGLGGAWAGWIDREIAGYLPVLLALTVVAQLLGIQLILLRFADKPILFAGLSFLDLSLSALASVCFILVLDLSVVGALLGMLVGKSVCVALAWRSSFPGLAGPMPTAALYRRMLAYALPTMPSVLLNWLQTTGTRVLLAVFLTLSDVAVASVAIRVAALYGFVTYSFRLAWEPHAFRNLETAADDPGLYNRALQMYVIVMFLAAGVATLASPVLVAVFAPPEYSGAVELVGIFVAAQFWAGMTTITVMGIHGARNTSRLTYVFGLGAAINVAALTLLSPAVGVTAAAIGLLLSSIASAVVAALYSRRLFNIRFDSNLIVLTAACTLVFSGASWFAFESRSGGHPLSVEYVPAIAALLVVLAVLYAFLIMTAIPRARRLELVEEVKATLAQLKPPA